MKNTTGSLIISIAIVLTALVFSNTFKNRNKANNVVSVTGLGKEDFVSDLIVWSGSFTRKNMQLKDAYSELDKDQESIRNYLVSKGMKPENIVFSSVDINKDFDWVYNGQGNQKKQVFNGYSLRQSVTLESNDVNTVENISRQVSELINSGVEFYSNSPQYYYTKLAELKIEMIAEATKDAQNRAKKIAENAGGDIGSLKSADLGVFQIVAQNSSEDFSWGGSFNTTSKKKTATVTIKLEYELD